MMLPKVLVPIRSSNGDFYILEAAPSDLDWPELRALWQVTGVARPLCFAPPEDKIDLFFSYACQEAGVPISLGTVFNPGWTDMFFKTIAHDCLVLSSKLVPYLAEGRMFKDHLGQLKQVVIVGDIAQDVEHSVIKLVASGNCHRLSHPKHDLI
ncbi:hypothetical protein [Sulfitobacter sp. SH22]